MDINLNGVQVEELSTIVHASRVEYNARRLTEKLKEMIPRQMVQVSQEKEESGRLLFALSPQYFMGEKYKILTVSTKSTEKVPSDVIKKNVRNGFSYKFSARICVKVMSYFLPHL